MFLSVAGHELFAVEDTWRRDKPETQGEDVRMENNVLGSTRRAPKAVASGEVVFLTTAELTAFEQDISVSGEPGVPEVVIAESDTEGILRGASLVVFAELESVLARNKLEGGVYTLTWRGTLRLREV